MGFLVPQVAAAGALALAGLVEGPAFAMLCLAGAVRLGVPPFHGYLGALFERLPIGAVLLVGVGFLATGLLALHDGLLVAGPLVGPAVRVVLALGALWVGLATVAQTDVRRRIAGFLAAQGTVWAALLSIYGPAARAVVGGWALATLLAFAALVAGYARLWAFSRTGDLRAYGGLARIAPMRAGLLMFALGTLVAAPLLSSGGRGLALLAGLTVWQPLIGVALTLGWAFGALGLGLAVYRTLRGAPPAPIEAPDFKGREWLWAVPLFAVLVVLSFFPRPLGGLAGLWPALTGGLP